MIVEYNGGQHRTDEAQFEKDVTRIESFRDDGWTVVEVRKGGLFEHPEVTVDRIARALGAGARPRAPGQSLRADAAVAPKHSRSGRFDH